LNVFFFWLLVLTLHPLKCLFEDLPIKMYDGPFWNASKSEAVAVKRALNLFLLKGLLHHKSK